MSTYRLPSATHLGQVAITVSDLERSLAFYRDVLGFQVHRREADALILGAGASDLVELRENRTARRVHGVTGLYHFAILVPTRRDLAHILHRIAQTRTPVTGFADHLVSEAIYLPDPDGNGIEIYRDRPRHEWYGPDGQMRIATEPLDVEGLLAEAQGKRASWTGLPAGARLGHIHLHVADLNAAIAFYRETLGFDLIMRYGPSAGFLSAGGYHHHIGVNTWAGENTPAPPADAVGLRYFTIKLPDTRSLRDLQTHLHAAGVPFSSNGKGVSIQDPSHNQMLITASQTSNKEHGSDGP